MRHMLIVSMLTLVMAVVAPGLASAGDREVAPSATLVSGAAPSISVLSEIEKYASPVVRPVACKADCEQCRESCYARMRAGCNTDACRKAFSQCMKGCWNAVCKHC